MVTNALIVCESYYFVWPLLAIVLYIVLQKYSFSLDERGCLLWGVSVFLLFIVVLIAILTISFKVHRFFY